MDEQYKKIKKKLEDDITSLQDIIKDFDKAIELNPNFSEAYFNRGKAKEQLAKMEYALNAINDKIETSEKNTGGSGSSISKG